MFLRLLSRFVNFVRSLFFIIIFFKVSRKNHQYLINCIHEMYDAFSFESLKHSFREIKYQFWRGRGRGRKIQRILFYWKRKEKYCCQIDWKIIPMISQNVGKIHVLVHGPGAICSPPRVFCKPWFLVRLWYTKTIAIVLTEQFLRLFGPRVENELYIYRKSRIFVIGPKNPRKKWK